MKGLYNTDLPSKSLNEFALNQYVAMRKEIAVCKKNELLAGFQIEDYYLIAQKT